ncbi:MAG: hypothetical protein ACP5NW_03170 [Candidatus Woesearchaeota archaeon]
MKILIFVYDTDSGFFASVKDRMKRMMSPSKHTCRLCRLTYGKIFMKRVWRDFLGNLSYQKIFFHKKEFKRAHPEFTYLELPAVLLKNEGGIKVLLTAQEIASAEDVDGLIGLLGRKLSGL